MKKILAVSIWLGTITLFGAGATPPIAAQTPPNFALPPPEEIPEEVLRTEIVTEANSPLDGEPITAAEYAELQAELAQSKFPPQLSPQLRHLIFLLQIRELLPVK
ncbi:MAG: hypothetical protein SAJ37_23155 [Oscillatoria sp. PMC 1068.18]|nr:hypothetical protein [Oscillatoria sp. PMC 1076.18]MEC4991645.1 hypothetical protein [Oscillatoria sp. PMC 1068.18]